MPHSTEEALGRAQEKYPVQIHAAVAASNHYHLILTPADVDQLADFMEFVNGNLARETNHLLEDWSGPVRARLGALDLARSTWRAATSCSTAGAASTP